MSCLNHRLAQTLTPAPTTCWDRESVVSHTPDPSASTCLLLVATIWCRTTWRHRRPMPPLLTKTHQWSRRVSRSRKGKPVLPYMPHRIFWEPVFGSTLEDSVGLPAQSASSDPMLFELASEPMVGRQRVSGVNAHGTSCSLLVVSDPAVA
jgi:hypothetical protein